MFFTVVKGLKKPKNLPFTAADCKKKKPANSAVFHLFFNNYQTILKIKGYMESIVKCIS